MKGNIRAIVLLLSITGLIGSVATYKVALIIFSGIQHTSITYHIDKRLSQESQQQIIACIENNKSILSQNMIDTVCTQFKSIDTIQLRHTPHGAMINITAHELSAMVNDQSVVTATGAILEKTQYNSSFFNTLKHITVHGLCDSKLPIIIRDWIDRASPEIFRTFDVTWFDENTIELKNKKNSRLVIRCAHEQPIDSLAINACAQIKKALVCNSIWATHHELIADVRFDRQIIVSKR